MCIYILYYVDCRNPQKKCCFQCFQDAELCDDVSQLFHPFGGCYTETPPKTKVKKEMMLKNVFIKKKVLKEMVEFIPIYPSIYSMVQKNTRVSSPFSPHSELWPLPAQPKPTERWPPGD